jgi:hypothetical protein
MNLRRSLCWNGVFPFSAFPSAKYTQLRDDPIELHLARVLAKRTTFFLKGPSHLADAADSHFLILVLFIADAVCRKLSLGLARRIGALSASYQFVDGAANGNVCLNSHSCIVQRNGKKS